MCGSLFKFVGFVSKYESGKFLYFFSSVINFNESFKFEDDNGICIDNFINKDRLQTLHKVYQNSVDLWNGAKCYGNYFFHNALPKFN